jgi:hypothetical protein
MSSIGKFGPEPIPVSLSLFSLILLTASLADRKRIIVRQTCNVSSSLF